MFTAAYNERRLNNNYERSLSTITLILKAGKAGTKHIRELYYLFIINIMHNIILILHNLRTIYDHPPPNNFLKIKEPIVEKKIKKV